MSDVTQLSAKLVDAHLAAQKDIRAGGADIDAILDELWALRCYAELKMNFSSDIPKGPKRDHLWTVVCNVDRYCSEFRDEGAWEPRHMRAV